MKKLFLTAFLVPVMALAQTYPSPTFNSVTLQNPLTAVNGGTGSTSSTGTGSVVLSNSPTFTGTPIVPGYAPIASPTFTGTATLPVNSVLTGSPAPLDSTNKIANTFYVQNSLNGTQAASFTTLSASSTVSGAGFSSLLAPYAPLASPILTGNPVAPSPPIGSNSTALATTGFVAAHAPCLSIMDFGGNNGNTGDNTAAFNATVAANPTGYVCVYFPPGHYVFLSQIGYTMPNTAASITLIGAGNNTTVLSWASGINGIQINFAGVANSVHVRDMSITTVSAGSGTALGLMMAPTTTTGNCAFSDITNVTIRGTDNYSGTDYWNQGVAASGVQCVNFTNDHFVANGVGTGGIGVNLYGTATAIPLMFNFQSCYFMTIGQGIVYGPYVQGVTVNQSNFVGGTYGIANTTGQQGDDLLSVTNSQFAETNADIVLQSIVSNISIISNSFLTYPTGSGIYLAQPQVFTIVGNVFANQGPGTNNVGIYIGTNPLPGVITGNTIYGQALYGIQLSATATHVNVQSNAYSTNGTNVINSGGGTNTVGGGSQ